MSSRLLLGGFLNVHKPSGMTSTAVVRGVSALLGPNRAIKVGHTGTLDPLASGVLVLCVGECTRLSAFLTQKDKHYQAYFELGQSTDSYDALGEITRRRPVRSTAQDVEAALNAFRGRITQTVPAFSAVRQQGERLYEKARRGEAIPDLPSRPVDIHALTLRHFRSPEGVLDMHCSSGTYVRSLVHDLGERLGCGAYLKGLIRTRVGDYELTDSVAWEDLQGVEAIEKNLVGPEIIAAEAPSLSLQPLQVEMLLRTGSLFLSPPAGASPDGGMYRAYSSTGPRFMGLVTAGPHPTRPHWVVHNLCGLRPIRVHASKPSPRLSTRAKQQAGRERPSSSPRR